MRKVCIITGTRAEYGLLIPLLNEIKNDNTLQLQLIAMGMHLSPEFGLTYKEIEKEFKIDKKIEILLSSDTPIGISKSMGLVQISLAEALEDLQPDIILILGDRFEIFAAASTAMIAKIPIAHLNGGESTEGLIDEAIRHSITKMSHLHFTATEKYQQKVIQLGENPNYVFNVGEAGLDNILQLSLLSKKEFQNSINYKLDKKSILVTFHPVTLENSTAAEQFKNLLEAVDTLNDTTIIFTKANSDTDGRIINSMIDDYVKINTHKCIGFTSLGQIRYLSALQYIDAVVGNSSSGLVEAPSFKIGTINIGDRQKGRIQSNSVINCKPNTNDICSAFHHLYSDNFQSSLKTVVNPYGNGGASKKIKDIIKSINLDNILKKSFYNIEFTI